MDQLDPALLRPGRIDRKVEYKLTTKRQAAALFSRFFPTAHVSLRCEEETRKKLSFEEKERRLAALAMEYAECIPEFTFSTAELQGFLLSCKRKPEEAVIGARLWVSQELADEEAKASRDTEWKRRQQEEREYASRMMGFPGSLPPPFGHPPMLDSATPTALAPPTPPQTPSLVPKGGITDRSACHEPVGYQMEPSSPTSETT